MGESQNQRFQLTFNRFLRVDFWGGRKQTKPVSGTAERAALATQPLPGRSELDTRGRLAYGFPQL